MKRYLFILLVLLSTITYSQIHKQNQIDSLNKLLQTETIDTIKADCFIKISGLYFDEGKLNEALINAQKAKFLARNSKTKLFQLSKAYHKGNVYFTSKSDYKLSELLEDTCLLIRQQIGHQKGIINSINTKGIIHWYIGDYPGALKYYMEALKICQLVKDSSLTFKTYNNIGIVYFNLNKFDLSINYYKLALSNTDSLKDPFLYSSTIDNIALVYFNISKFNEAFNYHTRALKIRELLNDEATLSNSYLNMANVLLKLNQKDKALYYYKKTIELKEKVKDLNGLAYAYTDISSIYISDKNYSLAKGNLLQAYHIAKEINSLEHLKTTSEKLSLCYNYLNDYKEAYKFSNLSRIYKDSIFSSENNKVMMEMESKYQSEKKEIENKLLKNENRLQALESEKKDNDIKRQRIVIALVSFGLLIIAILAFMVYKSYKSTQKAKTLIEKQKKEVESQKHIIELHQKETIDSINYAKRIQYALLANNNLLKQNLNEHFVLFKPKDIVSGDFYWATKHENKFYLAVCDSTGHGVPGAFMSLLNMGFLSEAIKEKNITKPNEILNYVRKRLIESIGNEGRQDGMDAILICIDRHENNQLITYAAANNKPVLVSNNLIIEHIADKMPVGKGERTESFTHFQLNAKSGDMLYLYTDGFADQFGGPKGKKFKYKQLNELLIDISSHSIDEQNSKLISVFDQWKSNLEQVDDVLLIGFRI